jgi:hypothetical protein
VSTQRSHTGSNHEEKTTGAGRPCHGRPHRRASAHEPGAARQAPARRAHALIRRPHPIELTRHKQLWPAPGVEAVGVGRADRSRCRPVRRASRSPAIRAASIASGKPVLLGDDRHLVGPWIAADRRREQHQPCHAARASRGRRRAPRTAACGGADILAPSTSPASSRPSVSRSCPSTGAATATSRHRC